MSSALAHPAVSLFSESSRLDLASFHRGPPPDTEHIQRWPSFVSEGGLGNCSTSGLPPASEIRAMTGTSLNLHNPRDVVSQNYYPSRLSYPDQYHHHRSSPRGWEVRHHQQHDTNVDHQSSSPVEQSQVWCADKERENTQARKNHPNSEYAIASYLQIPASINSSKGSLAEFAAEITCLFWFESAATLQRSEETSSVADSVVKRLAADAFPTIGFLKWVTTILTTTQVTQNVILLALLFIHRLKKFNPGVSGKKGSEYRLLTVALMLGNKFLDDNTYTNKTWAEVSGISVTEIHIMEVEFLSNMRYNLYVSEEEWKRWQVKLARFSIYINKASKAPLIEIAKPPAPPVTPAIQTFSYKLPSPPSPARYGPPLPMYQPSLPNPLALAPHLSHPVLRHYHETDHDSSARKRSVDVSADMPATKRLMSSTPASHSESAAPSPVSLGAYTPSSNASSSTLPEIPNIVSPLSKLPVPNVPSSSSQMPRQHPHLAPLSVPPGRAMSMMYPHVPSNWTQPVTPVGTMPPTSMNLYANPIPTLGETTRSQYASANASPSAAVYGTVTPSRQLSPSYFLTHRNSPYRPVRGVNTLLIPPPPSASLHAPTRSIGVEQMRYQPLGKAPTEARAGIVPYMPFESWPQPWTAAPNMASQFAFHA